MSKGFFVKVTPEWLMMVNSFTYVYLKENGADVEECDKFFRENTQQVDDCITAAGLRDMSALDILKEIVPQMQECLETIKEREENV